MTESRSADHFERLYQSSQDPWEFLTSAYEHDKYRNSLAALSDRRYESALEVGCSIGVLTRMLAPRCERLLGVDIVDAPLTAARAYCADMPQVRFQRMQVPRQWPDESFDLIVFSEVLYFLSSDDIRHCAEHALNTLLPSGIVLLVNWTGEIADPCTGDVASDRFIASVSGCLRVADAQRHANYRLERLVRDENHT
jgi:SAM-dependent methyltransferase